ncbi:aquaporin family protein [Terrimonas sp. NA20]|uniref:Aquaporin family protein n=1 Tax=Terrimonas ginsenosidimutans TaxID=2908004 RepID=A0ABS9KZW0_9BACT|nr:MIP/aquaporin family protein [Terrimonas ginsenosidimutans]MCG2617887.1 aquaporin family protein [Terrimonas ginsenosidimutans]
MTPFVGELIGSFLLMLLGSGVVANVVLEKTKGHSSGWIVISFGWAMSVFVGVYASNSLGGSGHLNPAVSLALAVFADFDKGLVLPYIAAQVAGTFLGASVAWIAYKQHFDATANADLKMAVFCTSPAIRSPFYNFITEIIGSFVLVLGALAMSKPATTMGSLDALPVSLLVLGIGLSLGGPTGYAINPARDLGPRFAHFVLPIRGKRNSDWSYAWIPIAGPIAGALIAAWIYAMIQS